MTHVQNTGPQLPIRPFLLPPQPRPGATDSLVQSNPLDSDSKLATTLNQLQQMHPKLNMAQLGNLLLNQTGQVASYDQLATLRPSYQSDTFNRYTSG